jgi:hypothetical protein
MTVRSLAGMNERRQFSSDIDTKEHVLRFSDGKDPQLRTGLRQADRPQAHRAHRRHSRTASRVLSDLAVAVADGADAVSGIAVLTDRQEVFGQVASMPTAWRVLDRVDAEHLPAVRAARAAARQAAWAAGAGPDLGEELRIDRRVAAFVVVRTSMLEAQHRASTLS